MKTIWLVDASTYSKTLPDEIISIKRNHYKIKKFVRNKIIGKHLPRGRFNYSIGLLYLAGLLENEDCLVKYLTIDDVINSLLKCSEKDFPYLIGFSAVTPTVPICAKLSKKIKKINSKIKTILGGSHARIAQKLTKKRYPIFDKVISESGIDCISEITDAKYHKAKLKSNILPYHLLPNELNLYAHNLISKTGCPFSCEYCQDRTMISELPDFEENIRYLSKKLPPLSQLHIADSTLGGSIENAITICNKLKNLCHNFVLSCDIRPEFITKQLVRKLVEAGFREVRLGIDSVDLNISFQTKRHISRQIVEKSLNLIRNESNLYISTYFLTGLPGTTDNTSKMTDEYITKLFNEDLIDQIKHHIFVPYPRDNNSLYYNEIKIYSDDWSDYDRYSYPVYSLPFLSRQKIWESYISTEKHIIAEWMKKFNFQDVSKLKEIENEEYQIFNYSIV